MSGISALLPTKNRENWLVLLCVQGSKGILGDLPYISHWSPPESTWEPKEVNIEDVFTK